MSDFQGGVSANIAKEGAVKYPVANTNLQSIV